MTESLTAILTSFLDREADLEKLKDPQYKTEFFDRISKEHPKLKRNSIEATYSKLMPRYTASKGIEPDQFKRTKPKKFSGNLSINANIEKKDAPPEQEPPRTLKGTPLSGQQQQAPELPAMTLKPVAAAGHTFLRAIVVDMEELTESEKDDLGACLEMAFGSYLQAHEKVRQIAGIVGILGLYGNKIRKARKASRERRAKEAVETKHLEEQITPQAGYAFQRAAQQHIENELTDDR